MRSDRSRVAHQVGEEHQAAGENADDGDGLTLIVGTDLVSQFADALLDALGWKENLHTWGVLRLMIVTYWLTAQGQDIGGRVSPGSAPATA